MENLPFPEPPDGTKLVLHLTGNDKTWPGEETWTHMVVHGIGWAKR